MEALVDIERGLAGERRLARDEVAALAQPAFSPVAPPAGGATTHLVLVEDECVLLPGDWGEAVAEELCERLSATARVDEPEELGVHELVSKRVGAVTRHGR